MCGIIGVYYYGGGAADRELIARQTSMLRHRGPDDSGVWCQGPVALGHSRLSVIDLSPAGHQPMADAAGEVRVSLNGEIYNWPELRARLEARGRRFASHSDTEVLLHLWDENGPALVDDLRGMFAFGLYDARRHTLLLARDRVGKKPLYYHDDGRRIAFASELKALLLDPGVSRDVDPGSIVDMLTFQYVPAPQTIFRGIRKLPAGHRLLCDPQGVRIERYWSLPMTRDTAASPGEAVERVGTLVRQAVEIRLRSDVPVGAFLSGGIDSSAVVALMAQGTGDRVRTFSVGFEDEENSELSHARRVAQHLGTDHHELVLGPQSLDLLPKLVWSLDEPFADDSMIPTYCVSELARRHVTVALSGDGGDEAFAGYTSYRRAQRQARSDFAPLALRRQLARSADWLAPHLPAARRLRLLGLSAADRHLEGMSRFAPRELARLLTPALANATSGHDPYAFARALYDEARAGLEPIPALAALDAQTYLVDDVLVKVDRMSMLNSLEVRAPLLDHVLLEYVARLPFSMKQRGRITKWALREAARPLLPPEIVDRGKQGFSMPLARWFDRGFSSLAHDVLLDARCEARGWLARAEVERLLAPDGAARGHRSQQVFTLVCLELWAQTWLDRPREALAEPLAPAASSCAKASPALTCEP